MADHAFEFLCPKCAAHLGWSQGEDARMVCHNCRHELEVQSHGGGKHSVKVIGEPAPRAAPPHAAVESDPAASLRGWGRASMAAATVLYVLAVMSLRWGPNSDEIVQLKHRAVCHSVWSSDMEESARANSKALALQKEADKYFLVRIALFGGAMFFTLLGIKMLRAARQENDTE